MKPKIFLQFWCRIWFSRLIIHVLPSLLKTNALVLQVCYHIWFSDLVKDILLSLLKQNITYLWFFGCDDSGPSGASGSSDTSVTTDWKRLLLLQYWRLTRLDCIMMFLLHYCSPVPWFSICSSKLPKYVLSSLLKSNAPLIFVILLVHLVDLMHSMHVRHLVDLMHLIHPVHLVHL